MSDDKTNPEAETTSKATFRGETVEPRILLSVTWIAGTAGNDTIVGGLGNDAIDGLAGNDVLSGGLLGDDVLRGGPGDDTLDGGLGTDVADYSTAPGGVTVSLTSNTASGAAGNDTLIGIESVMGSAFDDTLTDGLLNETLSGGGGNDTFIVGLGNDTVDGGTGHDTVSYAGSLGPVAVDLTHTGPQNTGLAGVDTLSNVEGVIGTNLGDTFAFTNPANGITYSVDGGGGADLIDLSHFASSAVSFSNGHLVVDMGSGQSFAIDHANVEQIRFADVRATVVTSNLAVGSFSSSGIFIDGGQAFRLDVNGPGSLDWNYNTAADTLSIADTNSTDATTRVAITDLNGTDLHVGTIAIDRQLGSLVSNVDVDGIQISSGNNSIASITIGGGTGTLGSFSSSGDVVTQTTIHAHVGSIDVKDIKAGFAIDGDVDSLALTGEISDTGVLHVQGDIGALSMDRVRGVIKVVGDVGSLTTAEIENTVTIAGDLDSAHLGSVAPGSSVIVENTLGTLDFQVGGVQHGATFAVPTRFVFDGTTQTATLTASASDLVPIANAGVDQSVNEGDLVSLNGLASADPEGRALTYTWVQVSGPPVRLSDDSAASPTFAAPEGLTDVDVQFALTVNDGVHLSPKDLVTVTIHADNDAPTANAGIDQTVSEGDVVTLTGVASSDPEAQGLSYTWVQTAGPAVTLSDANAEQPTFAAPEGLANTAVQFSLTVSDGTNTSSIDTVTVNINADDDAPTANAGLDQTVSEGDVVTLTGLASSDPEAQGLTYSWVQTAGPTVTLSNANAAQPTFAAPEGLANTAVQFSLTVSDGTNTSSIDTVTVNINADDDAPTANAGLDQTVAEGDVVTLTGIASSDPEAQGLTYTWVQTAGPAVTLSDASAAQPTFAAPEGLANTAVQFSLTVSDGTNTSSIDTVTVNINADNDAPSANAGLDQTVSESDVVTLTGLASSDPEAQGLTYTWVQTAGPAVTLSDASAAQPTFTAPEGLANTAVQFSLTVSDGTNTSSIDTVTVNINADNDAPSANAGLDQTVSEGDLVTLTGIASSDPEAQGLTYTWVQTAGPTVTLSDANAAQPTFTAPEGLANTAVQFSLTVSDGTNTSSIDTVTVGINADNDAPSANAGLDQTVSEGDLVTLTGIASSDPEAQGLTYSWVQTAGPAVTLSNANAAQPTFTAPEGLANTAVQFSLTVSDGTNTSSIDTVTVSINADDDAPSANAGIDQTVSEGDVVTLTGIASSDPEAQGLTYSWVQTAGPTVTLSNANAAQPTFTAPEGLANTAVQFSLTVSDGTNTSSIDTVTVGITADNDAPSANAGLDQTAVAGATVQLQASAVDPEGQPLTYTWRQVGGTPVTLSDANAANPTFAAPSGTSGTLVFAVDVSDGASTTTDTVSIAVGANTPPDVQAQGPSSLGAGDLGTLVAIGTDAEGDPLTYHWTQVSGPTVDLLNANQANATFLAPTVGQRTDLVFEVAVSDGRSTTTQVVYVTAEAKVAEAHSEATAAAPESVPVLAMAPTPAATPAAGDGTSSVVAAGMETETTSASSIRSYGTASAGSPNEGNAPADDVQVSWSQAATTPPGATATSRTDGTNTGEIAAGREGAQSEEAAERALLASPGGQPDLVVADAGHQVELATSLPAPTGAAKYVWTQVGGTTVALDELPGGKVRVHLPEVFTEEELVFQVALRSGTEQLVQEITIQVQPVAMTGRQQVADTAAAAADNEPIANVDDEPGHGLGRIWAAVTAFLGAKPRRPKQ